MSLQDPIAKMSKTDDKPGNYIALLDGPDTVRSKIRKAVTDPGSEIVASADKPAISNLLAIFAGVTGISIDQLQERYTGKGYGQFKTDLADAVIACLDPIQRRYRRLMQDPHELDRVLPRGAVRACQRARHVLANVYDRLGLVHA